MVIVLHLIESGAWRNSFTPWIGVFINGHFGVNVFFVISGFLITKLLLTEESKDGDVSFRNFYVRRILRIFPAYYFLLIIYFFLQCVGLIHLTEKSWLTSLTFTKQFDCAEDSGTTGHLWSLSVEEMFYLLWPFVFVFLKRYRVIVSTMVIGAVIIARIFLMKFEVPNMHALTIFQRADALMIGCLFALYYDSIVSKVVTAKVNQKLIIAFLSLALSLVLPFIINQLPVKHVSLFVCTLFGDIGFVSSLIVAYIMVISINVKNYWYDFLNNRFVSYIGKLSYSIYLWQSFFISNNIPSIFALPIVAKLLIIFAAANMSYYFIEKPFLGFKSRFA